MLLNFGFSYRLKLLLIFKNIRKDDGLENFAQAASAANIGIMFFRPKAVSLAEEWVNVLEKDPTIWDQNAFNDLFRKGWEPSTREDRLFPCVVNIASVFGM